jgi:hypothetical protein
MATITLRRDATGYGYVSSDGRYKVIPAYEPSIRGGSVSRPSYWIVSDLTGMRADATRRTLTDIRDVINERAASDLRN